jgi:hypothetical protein
VGAGPGRRHARVATLPRLRPVVHLAAARALRGLSRQDPQGRPRRRARRALRIRPCRLRPEPGGQRPRAQPRRRCPARHGRPEADLRDRAECHLHAGARRMVEGRPARAGARGVHAAGESAHGWLDRHAGRAPRCVGRGRLEPRAARGPGVGRPALQRALLRGERGRRHGRAPGLPRTRGLWRRASHGRAVAPLRAPLGRSVPALGHAARRHLRRQPAGASAPAVVFRHRLLVGLRHLVAQRRRAEKAHRRTGGAGSAASAWLLRFARGWRDGAAEGGRRYCAWYSAAKKWQVLPPITKRCHRKWP